MEPLDGSDLISQAQAPSGVVDDLKPEKYCGKDDREHVDVIDCNPRYYRCYRKIRQRII